MLKLTPRPRPQWHTVALGPDDELRVELTPPNFDRMIADRTAIHFDRQVSQRLTAVTNWSDVVEPGPDGQAVPVPFSREALADLLASYPPALDALLAVIRPLYERGQTEAAEKKSAAPPAAATADTGPSTGTPS